MTKIELAKHNAELEFWTLHQAVRYWYMDHGMYISMPVWEEFGLNDLENEIWRPAINHEAEYLVSNYSRVKSLPKKENSYQPKILKQYFYKQGYLYCSLGGKKLKVHRLVGAAFIPNPENKKTINHKRGLKWFNPVFNLEWNTSGENQRHALDNGLKIPKKGKDVHNSIQIVQYDLEGRFIKEWDCMKMVEKALEIDDSPISKCCKRDTNYAQAYGFIWRFKKDVSHLGESANLPATNFQIKNRPKFQARRKTTLLDKLQTPAE